MFIWQYINLPEDEVIKIQNEFRLKLPTNDLFFQNLNIETTNFFGMKIKAAVLIQAHPWAGLNNGGIHTDPNDTKLAINIPLENCEDSITSFWESSIPPMLHQTPNKHSYEYYDQNYCKKITEFKLTKPVIFNTSIPHTVTNLSNKWRRAISLRFTEIPWHLTESVD